jgi:hypothetical protein
MKMSKIRLRPAIAAAATTAVLAGAGTLATASPALANHGQGGVYQVELSANISGPTVAASGCGSS